ncbi:MAG: HD domain-containing protein [Bacteroidaceae bacterium]|nr:HD domain-containing protein [Bacteroidaceae bacterium]
MQKEYIVLSRQDAVARNNSPYINLKVANLEGNENICVFDVTKLSGPKVGQLVRFLNIRDNQGKKSATNMDMIPGTFPTEGHPLYHLVPRPIKREEWDRCLEQVLTFCKDETLISFIREQADILFPQYSKYPAATSVHHAFPGGLLNHTYQMLHLLEGIYPVYPYPDDIKVERIIVSILFHDWGKLCEYNIEGEKLENGYLLGHIYMSANYLNNLLRDLYTQAHDKLTDADKREINFIVHCVLAHHGQLEFGSPVLPCIPEAQLLNFLDNISAKADVFSTTGNMEKAFALGTNVIKG